MVKKDIIKIGRSLFEEFKVLGFTENNIESSENGWIEFVFSKETTFGKESFMFDIQIKSNRDYILVVGLSVCLRFDEVYDIISEIFPEKARRMDRDTTVAYYQGDNNGLYSKKRTQVASIAELESYFSTFTAMYNTELLPFVKKTTTIQAVVNLGNDLRKQGIDPTKQFPLQTWNDQSILYYVLSKMVNDSFYVKKISDWIAREKERLHALTGEEKSQLEKELIECDTVYGAIESYFESRC